MSEDGGEWETMMGGVVGAAERTGEEACERRQGEEDEERSLGEEAEAKGKKTSGEAVVVEGTTACEEGEAEERWRWGGVGEADRVLPRCWVRRRSSAIPFSPAESGSPGTD